MTLAALQMNAEESKVIRISTDQTDLILKVGENGRLYQTYLGEKLLHEADVNRFSGIYMPVQTEVSVSADGKYTVVPVMKIILNRL